MAILPWKLLHSHTIIKDRWIDLRADSCLQPDGTLIDPFYVCHLPDFVVAVAVTDDGRFLLVRQYRRGTDEILLELPAGCAEEVDRDPAVGAARELLEETGYAGDEPEFLCDLAPNASGASNYAHCYLIRNCTKRGEQKLDETEDLEVVLLTREELLEALRRNELRQAVHVAALLYAFPRLGVSL